MYLQLNSDLISIFGRWTRNSFNVSLIHTSSQIYCWFEATLSFLRHTKATSLFAIISCFPVLLQYKRLSISWTLGRRKPAFVIHDNEASKCELQVIVSSTFSNSTWLPCPGLESLEACHYHNMTLYFHRFQEISCAYVTDPTMAVRFRHCSLSEACNKTPAGLQEAYALKLAQNLNKKISIFFWPGPLDSIYLFNITSEEWTGRRGVLLGDSSPARWNHFFLVAVSFLFSVLIFLSLVYRKVQVWFYCSVRKDLRLRWEWQGWTALLVQLVEGLG